MIKNLIYLVMIASILSCGASKDKKKDDPRLLVTSNILKGHKYGYSEQSGPVTYYHMVEFHNDTSASILMGGDVMELATYYTKADSVYVTIEYTDPPYTQVFGYKDGKLVDRRGKVWTPE